MELRDRRDVVPLLETETTGSWCSTRDHSLQRRPKAKPSRLLINNSDHPTRPADRYLTVVSAFVVFNGRDRHRAEYALSTGVIYPGRGPPASGQEASTNPILTLNDR